MNNKIFFIIFIVIWTFLIILNIFNPKILFSEQENRMLAKFPSFSLEKLISGDYSSQMDTYINDHFVFRNNWIKVESQWERIIGKTENNEVYIGKDGYLFEKVTYGPKQEDNLKNIALQINKFSKNIDIPISFLLIPNSIFVLKEKLPQYARTANQQEIINNFYNQLENINTVDTTQTLIELNENHLYFKTDHHMTSTGAYIVYSKWKKSKNEPITNLESFKRKIVSYDFLGTFDSKAQVVGQEKDFIEVYLNNTNTNLKEVIYDNETTNNIFNEDFLSSKDKYSYFLNGNNAKVVVKTNNLNEKKILVLKDSYSHVFAQFLCQDYEEIHFIDPRYYRLSISDYIKEKNLTEALFLYNFSNIINDLGLRGIN